MLQVTLELRVLPVSQGSKEPRATPVPRDPRVQLDSQEPKAPLELLVLKDQLVQPATLELRARLV